MKLEFEDYTMNSEDQLKILILDENLSEIDKIYNSNLELIINSYLRVFRSLNLLTSFLDKKTFVELHNLKIQLNSKFDRIKQSNYHRDAIDRRETLKQKKIKNLPFEGFYHLTHISNIPSILINGLLAHNKLTDQGMKNSDFSNRDIKAKRNQVESIYFRKINDYVPLYINPKNPFMGSKAIVPVFNEMVLIEILPHVLVQKSKTLFSDGNAAQLEETNLFNNIEKFDSLHWNKLNEGSWTVKSDSQRIMCSEVLIPDVIETAYVQRLIIRSNSILPRLMSTFPNQYGIPISIDPDYFEYPNFN